MRGIERKGGVLWNQVHSEDLTKGPLPTEWSLRLDLSRLNTWKVVMVELGSEKVRDDCTASENLRTRRNPFL